VTNFHGDEAKKIQNGRLKKLRQFSNYVLEWMGLNFYYYDGLQPKMRAAIINERECTTID